MSETITSKNAFYARSGLNAEAVQEVRATLACRLWFVWFALIIVLITVPLSILQFISHQFSPTARNFKRWSSLWGRSVLALAGIRVHLEERARLDPEQPYVFVANHQNTLDILALAARLPYAFGFVAKEELAKVPMLGFAIRNSASLFINRSDRRRSIESMREAGERIRAGTSVLVYPEGSRSFASNLQPFKKGAFVLAIEAGVPVVPVTVCGAYRLLDERIYAGRPGLMRLVVGEPIDMTTKVRSDIPDIMVQVRGQMEAVLESFEGTATD